MNGPSAWSEVRSIVTANPPSVPLLLLPASNALTIDYTPRLDWSASTAPVGTTFDHYELWLDDNAAFTSPYQADIAGVANHEYTIPDPDALNPNTTYYWRVRAYNTDGEYSAWSRVRTFRTAIAPPPLISPDYRSSTTNRKPTFDWGDMAGASSYTIQVSTGPTFATTLVNATVVPSTYTPIINLPLGTLYWRVRANGLNGPSLWSDVWSFDIITP